jgi:hypothetical protein
VYLKLFASKENSASGKMGINHQRLVTMTPMVGGAHHYKMKCFIELFFLLLSFL